MRRCVSRRSLRTAEMSRLVEAMGQEALPEAESLALRPNPHSLQLAHLRIEPPHARRAHHLTHRILDHQQDTGDAVVLAAPLGDVVVEVAGIEGDADMLQVSSQLSLHRLAVSGPGGADHIALAPACQRRLHLDPSPHGHEQGRRGSTASYLNGWPNLAPRDTPSPRGACPPSARGRRAGRSAD